MDTYYLSHLRFPKGSHGKLSRDRSFKREARKLAMAAKYGNEAPEHEGPVVVWRVLRLAYFALRETGTDWRGLEPSSGSHK